jgi:hypothetical protein
MRIAGCRIEPLDHSDCKAWLEHVLGQGPAPADIGDPAWLLCRSDDGVTWGRRHRRSASRRCGYSHQLPRS